MQSKFATTLRYLPLATALIATPALAVKLQNKDGQSHEITVKCNSTSQTSISANSTQDIGSGSCTVTVKSSGSSASGSGNDTLVIKDGKVSN